MLVGRNEHYKETRYYDKSRIFAQKVYRHHSRSDSKHNSKDMYNRSKNRRIYDLDSYEFCMFDPNLELEMRVVVIFNC